MADVLASRRDRFTVLIGNPKPRSRTRAATLLVADQLRTALGVSAVPVREPQVVDLAETWPGLLVDLPGSGGAMSAAAETVCGAGLLLVASPTFKGTFSGVLKVFIDGLPRGALRGTVAVPLMTADSPAHQHAVNSYLRPLLTALGATVACQGLSVLTAELRALDATVENWLAEIVPSVAEQLRRERGTRPAVGSNGGDRYR
jgi:FMN reductase